MFVGGMENGTQSFDVLRVFDVHVRVGEMKLEAGPQMRIVGAARDLLERVVSQWIDAAEANQAVRQPGHFVAGPVVFLNHSGSFILNGWHTVRVSERVRLRK